MGKEQFVCKYCNQKFPSGKSLGGHIRVHSPKKQSTSIVSLSSDPEIDQGAKGLMFFHLGRNGYNLALNSLVAELSENNSEVLGETKSSSGELLQTPDKAAVGDDDDDDDDYGSSDSYSSDSDDEDYFMNGPKKSDSGISVRGSLRNTGVGSGFNSFKNGGELGVKEGGSKHGLGKSKRVSPFYESDSYEDTNSKIHRSSDGKFKKASGANKKVHECPICFKVYSSGQALGGHKRSHANQEQRNKRKRKAADMQFDVNLPADD